MPKGLGGLNEKQEQREKERGEKGQFIPYLRLKDDQESARIRILTEADEVWFDEFHNLQKVSSKGKKFWRDELCKRTLGADCEVCENATEEYNDKGETSLFPRDQFLLWTYVYFIDWAEPGKGREEVQVGRITRYREHVNGFMMLRMAGSHAGALTNVENRTGTLVDRDYDWIRSGAKGTNKPTYALMGEEPTDLAADIVEKAALLPTLEDVAYGKVEKLPEALAGEGYKAVSVKDAKFEEDDAPTTPTDSNSDSETENDDIDPDELEF